MQNLVQQLTKQTEDEESDTPSSTVVFIEEQEHGIFKFTEIKPISMFKGETKGPTDDNHEVVYEAEAVIETETFAKDEIQEIIGHDVMDVEDGKKCKKRRWKRIRYTDSDMEVDDPPAEDIKRTKVSNELVYDIDNNSDNNSETSEQYPVLPKLQCSVGKIEISSEDSEDDLIDEDIIRDVKHKELYITGVKKNEFTKMGKMKKTDRVYNSHHPCPFCGIMQTNFSHHILSTKHMEEQEVKEIIKLDISNSSSEEKKKIMKDRKRMIDLLRLKGCHQHNMKVNQSKTGEIILARRILTSESFDIEKYGACPSCLGWFLISNFQRHQSNCLGNSTRTKQSKASLVTQSQIISRRISDEASPALVREVFSIMTIDEVSKVAKNDKLIISLGNQWMLSNMGNRIMRKYYTSSVMRLAAKLLTSLRSITGLKEHSMEQFIEAKYYEYFAKAALICSKQVVNDEEDLNSPSNAIKLGYDIKRMASAKLGEALVEGDDLKKSQAENFLTLVNMSWSLKVTKLARMVLAERNFNIIKQLPLPEDIQKMVSFMVEELNKLDLQDVAYKIFRKAAVLALARITLYNRRRCHEVQALNLSDYRRRKSTPDEVALQMSHELTEFEKELLNTQEVVMIRGKGGKAVPVIIPKDAVNVLEYLSNDSIRLKVGIPPSKYLFANSNAGVFRGYDAIGAVKKEAGLKLPNLVKTSNMRKYMATMMQSLDITENQRQWILDHLGHTMDVHRVHYRQTSDLIERVHVSKLLLIQDFGKVKDFVGKKLEDIQLQDIVPQKKDISAVSEDDADIDTPNTGIDNIAEDFIPELHDDEVDADFSIPIQEHRPDKKKSRKDKVQRQKWSEDDVQELEDLFSVNLKKLKCPKQAEIEKKISISKKNGGLIHKRKRDNIKKKVSNMIQKLKTVDNG
ncbi:uncharacterized protein LOC143064064 [Mytilus galloprovincialis]|uniref:uncharacterized protein LOC143064064 n=1 Tax=Mytilus galloprovincialis TaxID=29158 RepID=UPI003F7C2747